MSLGLDHCDVSSSPAAVRKSPIWGTFFSLFFFFFGSGGASFHFDHSRKISSSETTLCKGWRDNISWMNLDFHVVCCLK